MKQLLSRRVSAFLILAATFSVSFSAEACQHAAKAAWIANAGQARIAARDDAECSGSAQPRVAVTSVIPPQQKHPGGTHR